MKPIKDYNDPNGVVVNGRRVEKWEDTTGTVKIESKDILYNYISPESFIVTEAWWQQCSNSGLE